MARDGLCLKHFPDMRVPMKTRTLAIVWTVACSTVWLSCVNVGLAAEDTSTSTLLIKWQKPSVQGRATQVTSYEEFQAYKKTQRLLLKSRFVLMAAIRKPEVAKLQTVQSQHDPARWLGGIIKVEFPDDAQVMSVSCTGKDPKEVQTLTKAVVDAYLTEIVAAEESQQRQRCSELEKLVSEMELDLRRKLESIAQLTKMLNLDNAKTGKKSLPIEFQMLSLDVTTLQEILREASIDLGRAKIELNAPPRVVVLEPADEPIAQD
jgi:hypothetical protein